MEILSTQIGEVTSHLPVTQTRSYNLYVVAEDCAPPKDNEGILFVHKGQIYDVIENKSDWWWARLVRDLTEMSENICQQGWVPGSFLEKYEGSLTADEQTNINTSEWQRCVHVMDLPLSLDPPNNGSTVQYCHGESLGQ